MYKNKFFHTLLNGDIMKDLLWDLFKNTGKIEYYIKYKEEVNKDGKRN